MLRIPHSEGLLQFPSEQGICQAVLILYGLSASLGMFAIILFDSGIWKALSFLLLIISTIAMGYRNFIQEQEARPKIEGKVEKNQEEK